MIYPIVSSIAIIACWMLGGQIEKSIRRYGIPFVLMSIITYQALNGVTWWHNLPLMLTMPELFLGYGPGSWAAKMFIYEPMIRLAYAVLLAIPLVIVGVLNSHYWLILLPTAFLIGSFQIHAGGIKVGKKDFLWEDLFRSVAFACSIWLVCR